MQKDYYAMALELHRQYPGKLGTTSLFLIQNRDDLSWAYSP